MLALLLKYGKFFFFSFLSSFNTSTGCGPDMIKLCEDGKAEELEKLLQTNICTNNGELYSLKKGRYRKGVPDRLQISRRLYRLTRGRVYWRIEMRGSAFKLRRIERHTRCRRSYCITLCR